MSRIIVITGASSGIGQSLYDHFSGSNSVFGSYCNTYKGDENLMHMDFSTPETISGFVEALEKKLNGKKIDVLINNAGITLVRPVIDLRDEELENILKINAFGPARLVKQLLPYMSKRARVINIGSISGSVTFPFMGAYSASKSALKAITKALRIELTPLGIEVALIEPGNIKTPIWDKFFLRYQDLLDQASEVYQPSLMEGLELAEEKYASAAEPKHFALFIEKVITSRKLKFHYVFGSDARKFYFFSRVLPYSWFERLIIKKYKLNH